MYCRRDLLLTHTHIPQRNEIRTIPRNITDLSKLESLSVAHNRIEEIPTFLTSMERLHTFDISHNVITGMSAKRAI
jgi:Leucine-rich repeat (LRR) protein